MQKIRPIEDAGMKPVGEMEFLIFVKVKSSM